jgi:nucleotide-binding universal stress UspA family protein
MKILICTDGSRYGLSAVHLGGVIAVRLRAEATLLCVVKNKRRDPERSLERAAQVLEESGATFTPLGRSGQLMEEMLTQTAAVAYDLVVVGYYARSFLEKAVWGSLAARIAHELPLPVLVVRDRRDTIRRILVGISGGGFTEACTYWGGRIADAFDARVTLLHVSPPPPLMYAGLEEVVESLAEFLRTDTPDAQAMKRAVAYLTESGVPADVELAHGLPERELLRVAHEQDVDLLVVGSSWAAQPMPRALLRNITVKVLLNTRRPVLVVRPVRGE